MKKRVAEQAQVEIAEPQTKEELLYSEYVTAKSETAKLEKKLAREERLIDHLGFTSERIDTLFSKLDTARTRQHDCLSQIRELNMA